MADCSMSLGCVDSLGNTCRIASSHNVAILPRLECLTLKIDRDGRNDASLFSHIYETNWIGSNHKIELEINQVDESGRPSVGGLLRPCKVHVITYLNCSSSSSDIGPAPSILGNIESVCEFEYIGEADASSAVTDLSLLCRSLVINSKDTLQNLNIMIDDTTIHMDCLHEFVNLKKLYVPYPSSKDQHEKFCATLPQSLNMLFVRFSQTWFERNNTAQRLHSCLEFAKRVLQNKADRDLNIMDLQFVADTECLSDGFKELMGRRESNKEEVRSVYTLSLNWEYSECKFLPEHPNCMNRMWCSSVFVGQRGDLQPRISTCDTLITVSVPCLNATQIDCSYNMFRMSYSTRDQCQHSVMSPVYNSRAMRLLLRNRRNWLQGSWMFEHTWSGKILHVNPM